MDKKIFEIIMASLTLASVMLAVLLYVVPLSENQITAIYILDFIVVILLAADFYVRMKKSKQGFKFIVKNWYEIPAMLPLFLFTVLENQPDIGGALRIFRLIRTFRLFRLLRLATLFRTIKYLKASGFIYFIIFSTVALVFGSIGIYVVEAGDQRSTIKI
jgi:voltage-gated potassium channel